MLGCGCTKAGHSSRYAAHSSVATPRIQLDPAGLREQVMDVVRRLLNELGSPRAGSAIRGEAHLDRDLGLGSLERVELVVRLSAEFGRELPDQLVAAADTVDDLVATVLQRRGEEPT